MNMLAIRNAANVMARTTCVLLIAALVAVAAAAQTTGPTTQSAGQLTEDQKIELLIAAIESLNDAVFIRNDTEYDFKDAAAHMRRKWDAGRDQIKMARDFIAHTASTSSQTGKPYVIRFDDGREMTSAAFLTAQLAKIESKTGVASQTSPDTKPSTGASTPAPEADNPALCADDPNPHAQGFNIEGSDAKAIGLADQTMLAMGGRKAWDDTRYITWRFFGSRLHVWDKHTGNIRVEFGDKQTKAPIVILMNIHSRKGRAWIGGNEVADADQLAKLLETGYNAWVNDGYWVFMPYKLKDSGVTLKYKGPAKMEDGRDAEVVTLTFEDVGVTPENKYDVYIANDDHLVGQWAYYENATDAEPRFVIPWTNWKPYGKHGIKLSDERGERDGKPSKHTDLAVFDKLPDKIFTSAEPVDLTSLSDQQD